MKVATYNANSVRSRLELVSDWLNRESPDILCLQETKVQDKDFPIEEFHRAGYQVVFRGQKSYSGVAVASLKSPSKVSFGLDDGGPADEPRLICVEIDDLTIINTYVPQGRSIDSEHFQYKLEWFERLYKFLNRRYRSGEHLIWCGDFNVAPEPIDVHDPQRLLSHADFHPQAKEALERVRKWGFVDVFRKFYPDEPGHYTFWDYRVPRAVERGLGWRIDHIWATKSLAAQAHDAWIDVEARKMVKPSDHTFLVAEFDI